MDFDYYDEPENADEPNAALDSNETSEGETDDAESDHESNGDAAGEDEPTPGDGDADEGEPELLAAVDGGDSDLWIVYRQLQRRPAVPTSSYRPDYSRS